MDSHIFADPTDPDPKHWLVQTIRAKKEEEEGGRG